MTYPTLVEVVCNEAFPGARKGWIVLCLGRIQNKPECLIVVDIKGHVYYDVWDYEVKFLTEEEIKEIGV